MDPNAPSKSDLLSLFRFGSPQPRGLLVGLVFGAVSFVLSAILRDNELMHRSPLIISLAVSFTALAIAGFWASLISLVPGLVAAALYFETRGGRAFAGMDPLEQSRFSVSIALMVVVGGLIAALRVDRAVLLARERRHRESEEGYRTLLAQASDAIFVSDAESRLVVVNPRACELLGRTEDELLGHDIREFISKASLARQALRYVELRTQPLVLAEREMVRKDGSTFLVEVSARLMTDGRTQAIARDITERRRSEDALRGLEAQLQHSQRLEAVGRLAAGVAHDFNNLLTVVIGSGQLLADRSTDPEVRARVGEIVEAGERGAALTRQLLAFGRRQSMRFESLDPNQVVRGFEKMLRRVVDESVPLRIDLCPDPGRVRADALQLEQVVLNLVVNARDAVEHGGAIEVRTHREMLSRPEPDGQAAPPSDHLVITVRDEGVGMDAATMARIFEPFFTTKPEGRGSGLGLATVYGIIQQSGGFLRVESAPGRGTSVHVCLPVESGVPAPAPAPPTPEAALPVREDQPVLLVEDEAAVRGVVHLLLERQGFRVVECASAAEAFAAADTMKAPPAVLVTDIHLTGEDGASLANRLAQRWPGLRVLYLSGYADPSLQVDGPQAAAGREFLAKPFSAASLLEAVARLTGTEPRVGAGPAA
jgi:PAS domain S-box-containing protein